MASFTVGKIKCIKCAKEWDGAFYDYSITKKHFMYPLCKKCFALVEKFIQRRIK